MIWPHITLFLESTPVAWNPLFVVLISQCFLSVITLLRALVMNGPSFALAYFVLKGGRGGLEHLAPLILHSELLQSEKVRGIEVLVKVREIQGYSGKSGNFFRPNQGNFPLL